MKTVLQVKGNPTTIAGRFIETMSGMPNYSIKFSRMKILDDSIITYFSGEKTPHLLALLQLKEDFEVRRMDSKQVSIYYKETTIMAPTPSHLSKSLLTT